MTVIEIDSGLPGTCNSTIFAEADNRFVNWLSKPTEGPGKGTFALTNLWTRYYVVKTYIQIQSLLP